jgi:hypothetical protein
VENRRVKSRSRGSTPLEARPEWEPRREATISETFGGLPRQTRVTYSWRRQGSHAEVIADELARRALKGDIRAAQELADRAEGRPGQNNDVPEADKGVKVIVPDVPRPIRGVIKPDTGPGQFPVMGRNIR